MSSSFVDLLRSGVQGASNAAASNVSGPVDLLAWLLRKGGVPVPSNAFGGSEWMRQQGLTAEPKNKLAGLLGEGVGLAAPFAIAAKAPQIAGAMNKADDVLTAGANRMADHFERTGANFRGPPNQRGAIVYHGSPHKFDRFDSSKIGTGEGAQAYGHGLYLAESPDVAKQYQKTLSADGFLVGDKVFDPSSLGHLNVRALATRGDLDGAIAKAQAIAISDSPVAKLAADDLARLQAAKSAGGFQQNIGALYKVDLPDEKIARMLDWDKPLSQQSKGVQDALEAAGYWSGEPTDTGARLYQALRLQKGEKLYGPNVAPQASQKLKEMGIPGIRYLDAGSRGAGAGTSNYVVFPGEEAALNILERNGSPINALVQALKGPR